MPKEDNMANIIEPSQACFGIFGSDHVNGVMAFRASKAETENPTYSLKYENIFKDGKLLSEERIDSSLIRFDTEDCYYICFNPKKVKNSIYFGVIEKRPSRGKEIDVFGIFGESGYSSNCLFVRTIVPKTIIAKYRKYGLYIIKSGNETYLCTIGGTK
jgi:hypothetical protein